MSMNWLRRKNLKFISLSLIVFFGCGSNPDRVSIVYLFDTSGSFHQNALPDCLTLAEKIFEEISDVKGDFQIFPQTHQVSTIDASSVKIGKGCSKEVKDSNLFSSVEENSSIANCLKEVQQSKRAQYTDIRGALYNASQSLQFKDAFKAIIVFSDLHEDVPEAKTFSYNLKDVSVFVVHEISIEQINNPSLIDQDKEVFVNLLIQKGVKKTDIEIMSLKTIGNDPGQVVTFLKNSLLYN